jgi:hypothetical protein
VDAIDAEARVTDGATDSAPRCLCTTHVLFFRNQLISTPSSSGMATTSASLTSLPALEGA